MKIIVQSMNSEIFTSKVRWVLYDIYPSRDFQICFRNRDNITKTYKLVLRWYVIKLYIYEKFEFKKCHTDDIIIIINVITIIINIIFRTFT